MDTDTGIVTFLNARLDEDEGYLKSNQHHLWTQRPFREVEAKRAIIAEHGPDPINKFGSVHDPLCLVCLTNRDGYEEMWEADEWPCRTLRSLAAVYSDHPDYRQEWKP